MDMDTQEHYVITLPICEPQALEKLKDKAKRVIKSVIGTILCEFCDALEVLVDPPTKEKEAISTLVAQNLSAAELMGTIAAIDNQEIKQKLAKKLKPIVTSSVSKDVLELFELDSFDDFDLKEDMNLKEHSLETTADRFHRKVYYAKTIILRKDSKYTIIMAYMTKSMKLPFYSLRALLQSDREKRKELEVFKVIGMHSLHYAMHSECPGLITLTPVDAKNLLP